MRELDVTKSIFTVNLNVMTNDPTMIPRAMEIVGRVAAGLAMEDGLAINMNIGRTDPDAEG